MKPGRWVNEVMDSVGRFFVLETTDGVKREGTISGLACREMIFNGDKVQMPIEIEVNGDAGDRIPLDRLYYLNITVKKR